LLNGVTNATDGNHSFVWGMMEYSKGIDYIGNTIYEGHRK